MELFGVFILFLSINLFVLAMFNPGGLNIPPKILGPIKILQTKILNKFVDGKFFRLNFFKKNILLTFFNVRFIDLITIYSVEKLETNNFILRL